MKLVKCTNCSAAVLTEDTLINSVLDHIEYLSSKLKKANNIIPKGLRHNTRSDLKQEINVCKKIATQIIHGTTQIEMRKMTIDKEKNELVGYLLANNLITKEKIHELDVIARKKVKEQQEKLDGVDRENINKNRDEFISLLTNRTKKDPTANKAINK